MIDSETSELLTEVARFTGPQAKFDQCAHKQRARLMSTADLQRFFVIPLSVQREGDLYLVGSADLGDFYQFPDQGVRILDMLRSGDTVTAIRSRLAAIGEMVDVEGFVAQLTDIGFIYPEDRKQQFAEDIEASAKDLRRVFSVDARIAQALFSRPAVAGYLSIVIYAFFSAVKDPEVRINWLAFYTDRNRTALLLCVLALSFIHVAFHELGHMLAAARYGIKSRYGLGNRLWNIVAESDITGILSLPKAQRYLPMLAGLLVDVLFLSLLTIATRFLLQLGASHFLVQVIQALILEIVLSMTWQFNVFVRTDLYYVLCNYLNHPDLDQDARLYLRNILYRMSFGRFGRNDTPIGPQNLNVLRIFSSVWLFGRLLSLAALFGIFLPTMGKYIVSAFSLLSGPSESVWLAIDTLVYALITLTMLGVGMYMWIKER